MRYVVTGGSGHTGSAVVERLAALDETEQVVVADVRPSDAPVPKVDFDPVDVRQVEQLTNVIERRRPDAVVHLASSHDTTRGREEMYETNVVGTNGVLAAAAATGTSHVLVISSAACYPPAVGSEPVTEAAPLRSNLESDLARDRATVDRLCQLWAARQPDRTMTIVRPCAVVGAAEHHGTTRLFTEPPYCATLANPRTSVQFLHEDDFVETLVLLVAGRHGGVFNAAGDGLVTLGECVEVAGLKSRRGPLKAYSKIRSRKGAPGGLEELELLVGTPVVSTERLRAAIGTTPRFTSREAFEAAIGDNGKFVADPPLAMSPAVADPAVERW
jgi:UDP-glucose 4-epimerase